MNSNINRYNKYNIKDSDRFTPYYFPKAEEELKALVLAIADIPGPFTELIVISYLKNHSLKSDWVEANPRLSAFITERNCSTDHLESLFLSSKQNPSFTGEYEGYIREQIADLPTGDK